MFPQRKGRAARAGGEGGALPVGAARVPPVLIGAHVSPAGGLQNAVTRGTDLGCEAIQIFHQSPRAWRPTNYGPEDFEAFNQAFAPSPLGSIVIHAVYLINTATPDPVIREKSLASLLHAVRIGDAIGSDGVILHAGSRKGDPVDEAIQRSGELVCEVLAETARCPILFENTAGTQGPLGRDFNELAKLIESAGGDERIGVCIDCCHLFASGFEIVEPEALGAVVDDLAHVVGLDRLRALHVNDSAVPLGANRDKHANLGEGEIGPEGIATFLSEPRFEGLPALLETPGPEKRGADRAEVARAYALREQGLSLRGAGPAGDRTPPGRRRRRTRG